MSYERWIRASEINEFVYCRRSWWLQRRDGQTSKNIEVMLAGQAYHEDHGRLARRALMAQGLMYLLVFLTVFFIAYAIFSGGG